MCEIHLKYTLLSTVAGGAFVVCITLSSAPWCFEHCNIGRWLQTSGSWSVVLKSRIWSYPGGDKYSFVDDVCPQYLHCTDEDQQSETARLSTVVCAKDRVTQTTDASVGKGATVIPLQKFSWVLMRISWDSHEKMKIVNDSHENLVSFSPNLMRISRDFRFHVKIGTFSHEIF